MLANLMRTIKASTGGGGPETIGSTTIGAATNGGYYAGTISDGGITYNLIAAPKGAGDPTCVWDSIMYDSTDYVADPKAGAIWTDTVTTGITSVTNGLGNTRALVDNYGSRHSAAIYCDNLDVGGKQDWYLPAKNELAVLYAAKAAFSAAGQAFVDGYYWSSTELIDLVAWVQFFGNGNQSYDIKLVSGYVRAVRRLPI